MDTIKAAVVGATGYAGAELVRLLYSHPAARVTGFGSKSFEGKPLSEVFPSFRGFCDEPCVANEQAILGADVVFAALPHGLSEPLAQTCLKAGQKFIDLGADFRLENEEDYEKWYDKPFDLPALHASAVYCIPELFRKNAAGTSIIANPGCYPTTAALGLFPALECGMVATDGIIIDSKSGVTGAGRGLSQTTHYPDCNEAFSPYKIAVHRHTPEIEQSLSHAAGKPVTVTFVPHLLPVNRGIVSTIYAKICGTVSLHDIYAAYEEKYKDEQFVRLLPLGAVANLRNVKYTNMCEISLHIDERTNTLIVVSTIDNMVKGAAGQAIQNMNLIFGLPEETGLTLVPPAF
ncbi:MAG: N-acetyl-gamma-glutamyl-phosphate reductase [Acutalibacteraceae bacterium]